MKRIIIISLSVMLITLAFGQAVYKGGEVRLSPRQLNYQGFLTDTLGNPVTNPAMSMTLGIWSASSGGTQLWFENQTIDIQKGIFNIIVGDLTTLPDSIFTKNPNRWLELTVGGITLSPRTRIVSTAYAYTSTIADTAGNAKLLQGKDTVALDARYVNEGQVNSISTPMIIDTAVTMAKIARAGASANQVIKWNGAAWAPANDISSADNHWTYLVSDVADTTLQMGGRWGLARSGNVLFGNADSTHVNFGVACTTGATGQNYKYCTVAGGFSNTASGIYSSVGGGRQNRAGYGYATIGGGFGNTVLNFYSTVAGGVSNTAGGEYSAVAGGWMNRTSNTYATISGGYADTASGYAATISGGYDNSADGDYASVVGGYRNIASGNYAMLAGGRENNGSSPYATIAGGCINNVAGNYASVVGGYRNTAIGNYAAVAGGNADTAKAVYGFVGSGYGNLSGDSLIDTAAVVAGGYGNSATGKYSFVGGGRTNDADTAWAVVVGGIGNTASGYISFIGGGQANAASGYEATIAGGRGNVGTGDYAAISGGRGNSVDSSYATISGGYYNRASSNYTFIGGGQYDTVSAHYSSVVSGYNNNAGDSLIDTAAVVTGGWNNRAIAKYSFVGGGYNNLARSRHSFVGGGSYNTAFGLHAVVVGGDSNFVGQDFDAIGGGFSNCVPYGYYGGTIPGGWCDTVIRWWGFATGSSSYSNYDHSAAFTTSHTTAADQVRAASFSTGTIDFAMDHPDDPMNKILNQYGVSSDEVMSIYRGSVVLDADGRAAVNLPDYFDDVNRNPMIQLTGVGSSDVYVAEKIKNNRFVVGGKPGIEVYWEVTGERTDIHAEIARIQTPVVQEKTGHLRNHSIDDDAMIGMYDSIKPRNPELFTFKTEEGRGVYDMLKRMIEENENK